MFRRLGFASRGRRVGSEASIRDSYIRRLHLERLEERHLLATIVVSNNLDVVNGDTSSIANLIAEDGEDGISFREALTAANRVGSGLDTIEFSIGSGVQVITILTDLPQISSPVRILGNTQPGYTGTPLICLDGLARASSNLPGLYLRSGSSDSEIRGLQVTRFNGHGIYIEQSLRTIVAANYIGTDGFNDFGNAVDGVRVVSSPNVRVGGDTATERNIISGNNSDGVGVYSSNTVRIRNNYIGTTASGNAPVGNSREGILLSGVVGQGDDLNVSILDNVISGNVRNGVVVFTANGTKIAGNKIGTNAAGNSDLGNGIDGILVTSTRAQNTTIGGTLEGERNIISGNQQGIEMFAGATNTKVQGNYIGTSNDGLNAIPNGNGGTQIFDGNGIDIVNSSNNTVGGVDGDDGTVDGVVKAQNIIAANLRHGIRIAGTSTNIRMQGNRIGLGINDAAVLSNQEDGVFIDGATSNTIGGTTGGAKNIIAGNKGNGVTITGNSAARNSIRGNEIFDNGNLAIDLSDDGITFNDTDDIDAGPNNFMNFPIGVSRSYDANSDTTTIRGRIDTANPQTVLIDVYGSDSPAVEGNAQGFIGTVTPNESGQFEMVVAHAVAFPHILATATDANGSTSEFNVVRPVIFIPGVSGSILGKESNGFIFPNYWPGALQFHDALSLYGDGEPNIVAIDAIRAVGPEIFYHSVVSQLTNGSGYNEFQRIVRDPIAPFEFPIAGNFDSNGQPNGAIDSDRPPTLFVFAYDWRKDISSAANDLKLFIEGIQKLYGGDTNSDGIIDKYIDVDIVAHSMGGLVSRRYILNNEGSHHVDRLITVNTPFLGAPKMLYALETGDIDIPSFLVWHSTLKNLVGSFTAPHQLLPSRSYLEFNLNPGDPQAVPGPLIVEDGWDLNNNNASDSYSDYDEIIDLIDSKYKRTNVTGTIHFRPGTAGRLFHDTPGQDDWSNDTSGVEYHHIVSVQANDKTIVGVVATTETVIESNEDGELVYTPRNTFEKILGRGDGTVPAISAERIGNGIDLNAPDARVYTFINDGTADDKFFDHTSALQNSEILDLIGTILKNTAPPNSPHLVVRSPGAGSGRKTSETKSNNRTATTSIGESLLTAAALHYVSVIGPDSIEVRDADGNTSAPTGGFIPSALPDMSMLRIGEHAHSVVIPSTDYYEVIFVSDGSAFAVEETLGNGGSNQAANRYRDVQLPLGTTVKIVLEVGAMAELRYDANGDGIFESVLPPSARVTGTAASDIRGPAVSISFAPEGSGLTTVSIVATDAAGVASIQYSLNGQSLQTYTGPFTVNEQVVPKVTVVADDAIANRSTQTRWLTAGAGTEPGTLTLGESELDVYEADGEARIIVTRQGGRHGQVSVDYAVTALSATPGSDVTLVSGTIVFEDDEFEKTFSVPITNDMTAESTEFVRISLANPTGGSALGTVSESDLKILDDDSAGVIEFGRAAYDVAETVGNAVITVVRVLSGQVDEVSVTYSTTNLTAVVGEDFASASGTLTFAAGEFVKTISVPVINDDVQEPSESLRVMLTSVSPNAKLGEVTIAELRILARPPLLAGDYNSDNVVDAADYVVWRKMLGQSVVTFANSDGNGSGIIDPADHGVWRAHFGQIAAGDGGGGVALFGDHELAATNHGRDQHFVVPKSLHDREGVVNVNDQHDDALVAWLHALSGTARTGDAEDRWGSNDLRQPPGEVSYRLASFDEAFEKLGVGLAE